MKRVLRKYSMPMSRLEKEHVFLVVSDLHNSHYEDILPNLSQADALLFPGDLANRYRNSYQRGLQFLKEAAQIRPVFFSLGNHDLSISPFRQFWRGLQESGALILYNDWIEFDGIAIGGVIDPGRKSAKKRGSQLMKSFYHSDRPKILLCHHPEEADSLTRGNPVDLIVSGHAHGGQIRIGHQGIYAPGQGFFPRLTRGFERPGLLVSAGAGNPCGMPRWGNPEEIILLRVMPEKDGS